MTRRGWVAFAVGLFIVPIVMAVSVSADRGGIPLDPTVHFEESAQNAIAAWNGQKECLILSTDLRSPSPGRLLEMLPLPAAPYDIQLGNKSSFKTMVKLFNEKAERLRVVSPGNSKETTGLGGDAVDEYQGVEIVFSTSVGLHNITVVKIESQVHFVDWARDFAARHGASNLSIGEGLNWTVGDHLARGISYFVFDVVDLSVEKKTSEPVVYLFNTTYLYYPLKITYATLDSDTRRSNEITIFLVTDGVIKGADANFDGVHVGAGIDEFIEFSRSELRSISGPLAGLFNRSAFVTHYYGTHYGWRYYSGDVDDIVLRAEDLRRPTDAEMRAQYERADFLNAIQPLSPSLAYSLLRSAYDPGYAPPTLWLGLILLGIFIWPVALGLMFKGILERGDRKRTLWIAWLVLYIVGITPILGVSFLASVFSEFETDYLAVFLALLIPLAVVLYLGKRFKSRPAVRARYVNGLAFGMAAVQVLVFVFVPSSIVALPVGALCFPVIGIAGILIILITIVARWKAPAQPALYPPSQ